VLHNNDTRSIISNTELRTLLPDLWTRFRNYNKLAKHITYQLTKMFFEKVIDKVMDSDRVILPPSTIGDKLEHELYIGNVNNSSEKWLNSHTDGAVYSLIMTGLPLETWFKFSLKRKQELKDRILDGQPFY